jgi:outer membrane protein OmpA-like peptidoglycan-associated protein/Tol biopolymer transport system component
VVRPCSRPWFYSYKIYDRQNLMKLHLKLQKRSTMASLAASLLVASAFVASASSLQVASAATVTNGPLLYTSFNMQTMRSALLGSTITGTTVTVDLQAAGTPQFSADGKKAVWLEAGGPNWAIKLANSDGTDLVTVVSGTQAAGVGNNPSLSPDGSKIALDFENDIHIIDAAAGQTLSAASRIVDSGAGENSTSPRYVSATKIAYLGGRTTPCTSFYKGVYIKDLSVSGDGTLLTSTCNDSPDRSFTSSFDVSPNGDWIVYRGLASNDFIGLAKTDNSGSRIVAYTGSTSGRPLFSPDGTKIAYYVQAQPAFVKIAPFDGTTVGTAVNAVFPSGVNPPSDFAWVREDAVLSAAAVTTTVVTTTTVAPVVTTVAPVATSTAVVPGVTVTDTKVYTKSAPRKVAAGSAIAVMTPAQAKVNDIVSLTPRICLAAEDDLVFIKTGRCVAQVVNEKTGRVLRALTTRVVADEVSELNVGNEIVTLAPIYFSGGSAVVDARAKKRLQSIKDRVTAAGTVLLVGHSGILMGNTQENQEMGRARAIAARNELRSMGAKGPFYFTSAGALAPATTKMTVEAQAKNRRVVIVLIP